MVRNYYHRNFTVKVKIEQDGTVTITVKPPANAAER